MLDTAYTFAYTLFILTNIVHSYSCLGSLDLLCQLGDSGEKIGDETEVGDLEDRCIGVLIPREGSSVCQVIGE